MSDESSVDEDVGVGAGDDGEGALAGVGGADGDLVAAGVDAAVVDGGAVGCWYAGLAAV